LSGSSPGRLTKKKTQQILSFARPSPEQEIELLPGVKETLAERPTDTG